MWSDILYSATSTLPTAETDTRTEISAGAVHDTKYLSVKHFSLHFCGGTCNKVSFRQQEFTLSTLFLMLTFVLVSCVYRAPNTNVDILRDFIIAILRNNTNRTIYLTVRGF